LVFRQKFKPIVDFDPAVGYRLAESVTWCYQYVVLLYVVLLIRGVINTWCYQYVVIALQASVYFEVICV